MGRLEQVRQRVGAAYAARRAAVQEARDEGFSHGYDAASAAAARDDYPRRPSPVAPDGTEVPRGLRLAGEWSWRLLVMVAAAAVVLWLVGRLRLVLIPPAIALLLAALLSPAVHTPRRQAPFPPSLAHTTVLVGGLV